MRRMMIKEQAQERLGHRVILTMLAVVSICGLVALGPKIA